MMTLMQYYSDVMCHAGWKELQDDRDAAQRFTRPMIGPEDLFATILAIIHLLGFLILLYFVPFKGIENISRYGMFLFLALFLFISGGLKIRTYEQSENPKYGYWMGFLQTFFIWISGLYIGSYLIMVIS